MAPNVAPMVARFAAEVLSSGAMTTSWAQSAVQELVGGIAHLLGEPAPHVPAVPPLAGTGLAELTDTDGDI